MKQLANLRSALLEELGGNDARLRFINTRLILSIGVDLNDVGFEVRDAQKVQDAFETLQKMGFLKNRKEGGRGA